MNWPSFWLESLMAAVGTVGFSVLFQVPPRHYPFCALVGAVGWQVYLLSLWASASQVFATFIATVVLVACARWFSTLRRTPTIVFLICGIFTLVPGSELYYTAYYLFLEEGTHAAYHGSLALKLSVAIALGIVITYSLPARLFGWQRDVKEE